MFETFVQDVRYALRLFQRNRLFTIVASTTLAIGIATTTTVFSLANTMLLSAPEFVRNPEYVIGVYFDRNSSPDIDYQNMSYPRYEILSKEQDVFTEMAFYYRSSLLVTIDEVTQPVVVDAVTGEFFDVLGVPARNGRALNRALNEDDDDDTWARSSRSNA